MATVTKGIRVDNSTITIDLTSAESVVIAHALLYAHAKNKNEQHCKLLANIVNQLIDNVPEILHD